jgi:arginine N-succinyltransferase
MFLVRDARAGDLDDLHTVAAFLNSVNLPADRHRLGELIHLSARSFAGACEVPDRRYLFVLTDGDAGAVLGASMVFAQHGSRRAPHVYFDVIEEERYSQTLDMHVVHRVLRIGYNYKGVTEIGGLVLRPELRGHAEQLGRILSYVRFMYLARHRPLFRDEVLSELMPPLEPDGTSLLWEALGRKFTHLTYQEADRLSHENKEFIRALFPEEPIYATLLPPQVQAVIGQVGPATKGVEKMLTQIGFQYAARIDPFDGGPHFHAQLDDILPVRATRMVRVRASLQSPAPDVGPSASRDPAPPRWREARRFLVASESSDTGSDEPYRAVAVPGVLRGESLLISTEALRMLRVESGVEVACLEL